MQNSPLKPFADGRFKIVHKRNLRLCTISLWICAQMASRFVHI